MVEHASKIPSFQYTALGTGFYLTSPEMLMEVAGFGEDRKHGQHCTVPNTPLPQRGKEMSGECLQCAIPQHSSKTPQRARDHGILKKKEENRISLYLEIYTHKSRQYNPLKRNE